MKRIKLIISYDGTNYVGWQIQKNGIAIEQVINEELSKLLKEDITIIGASRTDSGVHALGNVAVFDTNTRIPPEKIMYALNQQLPDDIKIVRSEEVAPDFHPRYTNCRKTYRYDILNSRVNLPKERLYTDYVYYELHTDKMKQAAKYLLGEHDFTAFSSAGGQQKSISRCAGSGSGRSLPWRREIRGQGICRKLYKGRYYPFDLRGTYLRKESIPDTQRAH